MERTRKACAACSEGAHPAPRAGKEGGGRRKRMSLFLAAERLPSSVGARIWGKPAGMGRRITRFYAQCAVLDWAVLSGLLV